MKKNLIYFTLFLVAAFVTTPVRTHAAITSVGPASNFTAALVNGELVASFSEPASNITGYLVLRRDGFSHDSPTASTLQQFLNTPSLPASNWQVFSNNSARGGKLELEQGNYTYLVYMRDNLNNLSSPARLVVAKQSERVSNNLTADLFVLLGGLTTVKNNVTLTIAPTGSLAWLGGDLYNSGTINLKGFAKIPSGVTYDNGAGLFQISAGGKLTVDGTYDIRRKQNNVLKVHKNGTLHVTEPGSLNIYKFGDLQVDKEAYFLVDGVMEVMDEVQTTFWIEDDAFTTFGPKATFKLRKNLRIPKATWVDGSTLAWYHNGLPTGIKQSFSNFIWDVSDQSSLINLNCGLETRGSLRVLNTNGKELNLGSCDYKLGGDLLISPNAKVVFGDKLNSISGGIINEGTLTVVNELKIYGHLEVRAGSKMLLPKKTTIGGDLINTGELIPYASTGYELLEVGGRLENTSTTPFIFSKQVKVKGDLINKGAIVSNAELYLEGSLDNHIGSSFTNALTWGKVHFTNSSQQNRASLMRVPLANLASSAIGEVLIEKGRTVTLGSNLELVGNSAKSGRLQVEEGATLNLGTFEVWNAPNANKNDFELKDGATLMIGHAQGISPAAATSGAIKTTTRTYGGKAHYVYTGNSAQATGLGLPVKIEGSLTIDNPSTVTLSRSTTITKLLHLGQGEFNLNHNKLTLNGRMTLGTGTLKGSSFSELDVVNGDETYSITIPAVTLKQLFIDVKKKVDLSGDLTIHQALTMDKGILYTHANRVIMLPSATLTEDEDEADEGFVIGRVETEHTTDKKNTAYSFGNIGLSITYNGTPAGTTKLVRYTGSTSATQKEMVVNRAFQITTSVDEGLDAKLVFTYMKHELKDLLLNYEHKFNMLRSMDGGTTYDLLKGAVADKDAQSVTLNNINSFSGSSASSSNQIVSPSPVVLGNSTAGFKGITLLQQAITTNTSTWTVGDPTIDPFPVEFVSFNAKLNTVGEAQLYWTTASESNNSHFEVQRSADGQAFEQIGKVEGAGNSNVTSRYTFTDAASPGVLSPITYYRLKQIDFDGTYQYSKVIVVQQQKKAAGIYRVSINHITGNLEVQYANLIPGDPLLIAVTDISGRLWLDKEFSVPARTGKLTIPLNRSAKGVLIAKAAAGDSVLTTKVIK